MHCEWVGEMMSERLDGRLSRPDDELLDCHLAACASCRGEWEALASVDRFLNLVPVVAGPSDLHVRVLARLDRRRRIRQALIGGGALSLGALALGLLTLSPAIAWLFGAGSLLPLWRTAGAQAASQAISLLGTAARTGAALLRAFALPMAGLAIAFVFFAVVLNGLWLGALYRLQPNR